jgi:CRP/FNR family cyclic AMP-dependent transcriptional regulator
MMRTHLRDPQTPDIRQHPLWSGVDPDVVRRTADNGVLRVVPAGSNIDAQGDTEPKLRLLLRGSVRVTTRTDDGAELMLALCLLERASQADVVALERCAVLELDRAVVSAALSACPRFSANLARALADKLCGAQARQVAIAFEPVELRLARLLGDYADAYGLPVPGGTKIRVPLCQDELARALGVARRSVTRALKVWTEGGLLAKQSGCYVISDVSALVGSAAPIRGAV